MIRVNRQRIDVDLVVIGLPRHSLIRTADVRKAIFVHAFEVQNTSNNSAVLARHQHILVAEVDISAGKVLLILNQCLGQGLLPRNRNDGFLIRECDQADDCFSVSNISSRNFEFLLHKNL
ncbi:hypothetical protein D3C71_1790280 [compost metagenome]